MTESLTLIGSWFKFEAETYVSFESNRRKVMTFKNEGKIDRVLRVIVGAALVSLVFVGPQTAWGWIGLVPLVTGLIGNCPVYSLFGLNSCGLKH